MDDNVNFIVHLNKRDKVHYILLRGKLQEEKIIVISLYAAPNAEAPSNIIQTLTDVKYLMSNNRNILEDCNTTLTQRDGSTMQK